MEAASEAVLKSLDWILLIDHSGSTAANSTRIEGTLYKEMKESALAVARVAEKYDEDGITLIHFSSHVSVRDGVKADAVQSVFAEYTPGGITKLGDALEKAVEKAQSSTKEVVVIIYTDGEASDPSKVLSVLTKAGSDLGRPKIGFAFIQVGNDQSAREFLQKIDNELKVDVCATFSAEDADGLSVEQIVNAARTA